jgi:hypothetical protein
VMIVYVVGRLHCNSQTHCNSSFALFFVFLFIDTSISAFLQNATYVLSKQDAPQVECILVLLWPAI